MYFLPHMKLKLHFVLGFLWLLQARNFSSLPKHFLLQLYLIFIIFSFQLSTIFSALIGFSLLRRTWQSIFFLCQTHILVEKDNLFLYRKCFKKFSYLLNVSLRFLMCFWLVLIVWKVCNARIEIQNKSCLIFVYLTNIQERTHIISQALLFKFNLPFLIYVLFRFEKTLLLLLFCRCADQSHLHVIFFQRLK